jgi:hypothetical protein
MKTIIAGSRSIKDFKLLAKIIHESSFTITEILSGGAQGIDQMAIDYAKLNNLPYRIFPANWVMGKSAGYVRNEEMAKEAEALIAIWDGESRGTKHMIETAIRYKLQIHLHVSC